MMLRITKFKTKAEVGDGTIQEMYQYKVLDGDKIIGTYAVQADYPNADTMAQIRLGQFIFKQIKIEEITEQENKELVIKNKIADVEEDFK